ncbi:MAG: hypothetical protein OEY36_12110 [Gammaproteobacteria bacterium]|nr:hypothetical protein [Gammaproteobacteria bacterium]
MSKIYLGAILSLSIILSLGFWRYSSLSQQLGQLEQANRQLMTTLESEQLHKTKQLAQQQQSAELSATHHEKTLEIVKQEMQVQQNLLQHKIHQLQQRLLKLTEQSSGLKNQRPSRHVSDLSRDEGNEKNSESCADMPVAEFYLMQL